MSNYTSVFFPGLVAGGQQNTNVTLAATDNGSGLMTLTSSGGTAAPTAVGAAHGAASAVTSTASSAVLIAARATRIRVTVKNNDAANAVYIAVATATTASFPLKAGESFTFTTQEALNVIDGGSHAALSLWEEWN